jgi:hypothetical protein
MLWRAIAGSPFDQGPQVAGRNGWARTVSMQNPGTCFRGWPRFDSGEHEAISRFASLFNIGKA